MSTLAVDTEESISDKYQAARVAQPDWNRKTIPDRLEIINRFRQLLCQHTDDLARLLSKEMGKPVSQSRDELSAMPERIDFFLEHVPKTLAPQTWGNRAGCNEQTTYDPLGVIANISAWNYPYFVSSNVFIPALLTGNSVLFKPSEFVPQTGLAIAELLHDAGVPKDCFIPILGGAEAGKDLLEQNIDAVFFTGSHGTGQQIAKQLAGRLIPIQLELGGNDAVYVGDKADVAAIASGKFYNAGQSCCAVERIYVHESLYEDFVSSFVEEAKKYQPGDPLNKETRLGPLARKQQLDFLEDLVEDAVAKGAKLVLGGERICGDKAFFPPTVLVHVDHSMRLMREECFGPIIGIQKVDSDDQAVIQMNDCDYGLTASVFCDDETRARRLLSQLNVGSVYWNCCDRVSPRLPWTGRRGSGRGSTLSLEGIRAFVQPKAWHLKAKKE